MSNKGKLKRSKTSLTSAMAQMWRGGRKLKNDTRRHSASMNDVYVDGTPVLSQLQQDKRFHEQRKKSEDNLEIPVDVVDGISLRRLRASPKCPHRHTIADKIPPGYDTNGHYASTSSHQGSPTSRKTSKNNNFWESSTLEKKQGKGNPSPEQKRKDGEKTSQDNKDNKFDFNNVIKYKMDKQTVKVAKNDVIEEQGGKLMHKNNEGFRTLAENIEECRFEQKSPKEHILILPDNKKIQFYKDKKPSSTSSSFSLESSHSPSKIDNGVRSRIMQFLKIRPSANDLYEKGIYKNETVFGNTLLQLEKRDGTPVPLLVKKCVELVELPCNIISDGLYRTSASMATLQELRFAINKDYAKELDSSLLHHATSADVPSGLLKLFIRELKESLIGQEEFHTFHLIHGRNDSPCQKHAAVMEVIDNMQPAHRETLKTLLWHLVKVIAHKDQNGMSVESIGICWGQTMIGGEDGSDAVMMACRKNEVVQLLLQVFCAAQTSTKSNHPANSPQMLQKQISMDAPNDSEREKLCANTSSKSMHNLNADLQTHAGSSVHVSLQKTSL